MPLAFTLTTAAKLSNQCSLPFPLTPQNTSSPTPISPPPLSSSSPGSECARSPSPPAPPRGQVRRAFSMDVERLQRRPAGQHQQFVRIDPPMIRQQDAHRHVWAITGADTADGLVIQAGAQRGFAEALLMLLQQLVDALFQRGRIVGYSHASVVLLWQSVDRPSSSSR